MDFREEKETTDLYLEELASWGMMLEEYRELSVKNCLLLNINQHPSEPKSEPREWDDALKNKLWTWMVLPGGF